MRIVSLNEETKRDILNHLLKRSTTNYGSYMDAVNEILSNIQARGDEALFEYTERFDKAVLTPDSIRVTDEEIEEAYRLVEPRFLSIVKRASANIRSFHQKQVRNTWIDTQENGVILGQ